MRHINHAVAQKRALAAAMSALMIVSSSPATALAAEANQATGANAAISAGLNAPKAEQGKTATNATDKTAASKGAETAAKQGGVSASKATGSKKAEATSTKGAKAKDAKAATPDKAQKAEKKAPSAAKPQAAAKAAPAATAPAFKLTGSMINFASASAAGTDVTIPYISDAEAATYATASAPTQDADGNWVVTVTIDGAALKNKINFASTGDSDASHWTYDTANSSNKLVFKTKGATGTTYERDYSVRATLKYVKAAATAKPGIKLKTTDVTTSVYGFSNHPSPQEGLNWWVESVVDANGNTVDRANYWQETNATLRYTDGTPVGATNKIKPGKYIVTYELDNLPDTKVTLNLTLTPTTYSLQVPTAITVQPSDLQGITDENSVVQKFVTKAVTGDDEDFESHVHVEVYRGTKTTTAWEVMPGTLASAKPGDVFTLVFWFDPDSTEPYDVQTTTQVTVSTASSAQVTLGKSVVSTQNGFDLNVGYTVKNGDAAKATLHFDDGTEVKGSAAGTFTIKPTDPVYAKIEEAGAGGLHATVYYDGQATTQVVNVKVLDFKLGTEFTSPYTLTPGKDLVIGYELTTDWNGDAAQHGLLSIEGPDGTRYTGAQVDGAKGQIVVPQDSAFYRALVTKGGEQQLTVAIQHGDGSYDETYRSVTVKAPTPTPQPQEYTVTVDLGYDGDGDGKNDVKVYKVKADGSTQFIAPTRPGYVFTGLTYDKEGTKPFDFNTPVSGDITLYAQWKKAPSTKVFTVTIYTGLDSNHDGKEDIETIKVHDGGTFAITKAQRNGYTYVGLAYDREGKRPYDLKTPVTSDLTLYAQWKKNGSDTKKPASDKKKAADKKASEKKASKKATKAALPQTGDANLTGIAGAVAAAGAALAGIGAWVERRNRTRDER